MPTLAVGMPRWYAVTMPPTHRKRCKRFDVDGDPHCLTFSCYGRLALFSRPRTCQWMLQAFELGRQKGLYDLWAYVIMPEHVHAVLLPRRGIRVSAILTTLKQSVSKRALLWLHSHAPQFLPRLEDIQPNGTRCYRFWLRGGGYDRNLRTAADVHEKIDYTHYNPVRRGLVSRPEEWPWSSCRGWQSGEDAPIPIDRESVPILMPDEVRRHTW